MPSREFVRVLAAKVTSTGVQRAAAYVRPINLRNDRADVVAADDPDEVARLIYHLTYRDAAGEISPEEAVFAEELQTQLAAVTP